VAHMSGSAARSYYQSAILGLLLLTTLGCTYGISVKRAAGPDLLDAWRASVIGGDELSPRTMQTLRRWDLEQEYQRHPLKAYTRLQVAAVEHPDPDLLFALA